MLRFARFGQRMVIVILAVMVFHGCKESSTSVKAHIDRNESQVGQSNVTIIPLIDTDTLYWIDNTENRDYLQIKSSRNRLNLPIADLEVKNFSLDKIESTKDGFDLSISCGGGRNIYFIKYKLIKVGDVFFLDQINGDLQFDEKLSQISILFLYPIAFSDITLTDYIDPTDVTDDVAHLVRIIEPSDQAAIANPSHLQEVKYDLVGSCSEGGEIKAQYEDERLTKIEGVCYGCSGRVDWDVIVSEDTAFVTENLVEYLSPIEIGTDSSNMTNSSIRSYVMPGINSVPFDTSSTERQNLIGQLIKRIPMNLTRDQISIPNQR